MELKQAQEELINARMNPVKINMDRKCSDALIGWQEVEEKVLMQRSKLNWLQLGDGNNKYFHVSIKSRRNYNSTLALQKEDGIVTHSEAETVDEIMQFYRQLVGTAEDERNKIDIYIYDEGWSSTE